MNPIDQSTLTINEQPIQDKIYTIRGVQVMLDKDLSLLYGVETKRINEAVKNNQDKFQDDFFFELTDEEFEDLRSKFSTTNFAKTRVNFKVMGDIRHSNADITKAQTVVGYTPTHDIYDGMKEAIVWYIEHIRKKS